MIFVDMVRLACKKQVLLIWRNAFLVLDLGLDIIDGVASLNIQGDGLAVQRLDEDLHATPQAQRQMQSGFLLDAVVRQSAAVFKLLACKNQVLLIWRNAFLVLNLALTLSMVSPASTSTNMVSPIKVLTIQWPSQFSLDKTRHVEKTGAWSCNMFGI